MQLHAKLLHFSHPTTQEEITVEAPLYPESKSLYELFTLDPLMIQKGKIFRDFVTAQKQSN